MRPRAKFQGSKCVCQSEGRERLYRSPWARDGEGVGWERWVVIVVVVVVPSRAP